MASYVVGAAVFIIGASFLFNAALAPPKVAGLEHATTNSKAAHALDILLGTTGFPANWNASGLSSDRVTRLGLLDSGSSIRVDPDKFRALAKGSLLNPDFDDEYVDYHEAKLALGLYGYDFHLRIFPSGQLATEANYGILNMEDYKVAYVGDYTGGTIPSAAATAEQAILDNLAIDFTNLVRLTPDGTGSVFPDDSSTLRSALVPVLGVGVPQAIINKGSGTEYDFARVDADALATQGLSLQSTLGLTSGLALSNEGALGYTKSRELRAVVGVANFSGLTSATITWNEYVDTDHNGTGTRDDGDYGYLEVSPDGGETWYPITNGASTRSQDSPSYPFEPAGAYKTQTAAISSANCGPCVNEEEVYVAFHWVADGDNHRGAGWVIDNVAIPTAGGFLKTFERPEFDMLVIGSGIDQNALTATEIKNAIRDYVEVYGGRLLVLGGEQNINWLQPLFHVGIREQSTGVGTPDTTHPLLTVPNELDYASYTTDGKVWEFSGSDDADLFHMVVGEDTGHMFSVSIPDAFGAGGDGGAIMLTTYLPHQMEAAEAAKFFANGIVYGKYHQLYVDYGPDVPEGGQVSSARRTATMDITKDGSGEYADMSFILYIWEGDSTAEGSAAAILRPYAPRDVSAPSELSGNGTTTITWSPPIEDGAAPITGYNVYRGTLPGSTRYLTYVEGLHGFTDTGLTNGVTYYYNVTAVNSHGQGYSSREVNATPATTPYKPDAPAATGGAGYFNLQWITPNTGGAAITNYTLYARNSLGEETYLTVGPTTSYTFSDVRIEPEEIWHFKIQANNTKGSSAWSDETWAQALGVPPALSGLAATAFNDSIHLTWTTGAWSHETYVNQFDVTGVRILRGTASGGPYTTLADLPAANATFRDYEVANGTMYYYVVVAVNAGGQSAYSNEVSGIKLYLPTPPAYTASPDMSALGRIRLEINDPADLGHATTTLWYHIYRAPQGNTLVLAHNITYNGTITEWIDTGLTPGQAYEYRLAAGTAAGTGAWSPTSTVAVASTLVDTPVLTVTSMPGHIGLNWTATSVTGDILAYKIYRNTTATGDYALLATVGANQSFSDFTPHPHVVMSYKVSAVNELGEGTASAPGSGVKIDAPLQPTVLAATGTSGNSITLTITPASDSSASGVTGYRIYRSTSSGGQDMSTPTYDIAYSSSPQTFVDSGLDTTKIYYYKVVAYNIAGPSPAALEAFATPSLT